MSRVDERGIYRQRTHKFTSSREAALPLLRLFPLYFFSFWRNGFTDRQHDPHEQDCDVAGGIDGGRAILISSTTCIFTALSAQLVADRPFCGPAQRLAFLFYSITMTSIKSISRRNGGKRFFTPLGPPFFLRHLHRHDCIRQCFPKTRHELLHFSGQHGVHWHVTTRWKKSGAGGIHEGAASDPAGW